MRKLPDNYFDLAIADPPYGIGASRPSKKPSNILQKNGSIMSASVTDFGKKDWDNNIPTQEFFDELRRVSKNQIIWGANYFGLQGGMIVWDKINGNSDQYDCEIAYQSFNKRTDLVHYMWNGMFQGKYCGRDIRQAAMQQGNKALNEKRIHPTQKPVILYEWLLNNYAKKGDRIFDPMMGSQSSRIVAHRLGFDYVGCELDKEYFEKGCARFDSEWTKIDRNVANSTDMAENDNKSIRLMKSEISTLTPLEKEVIGSIVRGNGNLPDKMEGEEYDKLLQEVVDAEVRIMKRQPLSDRQREILVEENKQFEGGIEDFAKELKVDVDYLKASLSEHESLDNKPYTITVGTDNRPGGVEGEYHLQFKPDIMNVTFGEQEEVAKEFGGTMRVTDGKEWADFYHEADAVKFAEKVIGMDQERELQTRFDAFKAEYGEEPLYAEVTIRYKDDGESHLDIIKLSSDADPRDDDKVFFNVTGLNDLKGLINPDNGEDFYIVDVQGITFQPKSLYLEQDRLQELADAKAKLFATILEAKKDLGDEISITPTEISENGDKHVITEILPDFESPFEDQNIIGGVSHSGDEGCVHNLALCLENVNDAEALGMAVHEAHVKHLEQDAKQAIHERITNSWQRSFTPDQVEILNRYHQVAAPDKPAGEVFRELLDEVSQKPDVARKPEKWVTDTAKELDDLAEGITREEQQQLKR
jgi:site-specific DNA-methyltransferase (adenine-specific)